MIQFSGFGSGSYLTQIDNSDIYSIHAGSAYGGVIETIQLAGVTNLSALDYIFV